MMSLLMKMLSIKQTLIITSKCFNAIQSEKSCNCQVFLIFRFTLEKKRNIQVYITCKFEKNQYHNQFIIPTTLYY